MDGLLGREQSQLHPVWCLNPGVTVAPWCHDRRRDPPRAGCDEPGGHIFAVSHPYREPDRTGYTAASLDRVYRLGLGVIEQFERRPACIEGDDPPGPRTPIGDLFQPQHVTIEGKCLLEVLHG
jgi:hypothetical protein